MLEFNESIVGFISFLGFFVFGLSSFYILTR